MTLGERISAWRKFKGLTQHDLARAIGVTPAAVYQWEGSGESQTDPSLKNLEKLVGALDLTMERFYGKVPRSAA